LLRGRDPIVRSQAAQALGRLADPAAVPCLAHTLQTESNLNTQRHATAALGAIGTHEAAEVLAHLLYHADRMTAQLAQQTLGAMAIPEAAAALAVQRALARCDWAALAALDPDQIWALQPALGSPQFLSWTPGKQQRALEIAIELGLTPPRNLAPQLKEMGIFLGRVHTLGDVLGSLFHPNAGVRTAAIETLAKNRGKWVGHILRWRFRREAQHGAPTAAVAAARVMAQRGDWRGIEHYKERLYGTDEAPARQAAVTLGSIAAPEADEALFGFLTSLPAPSVQSSRTHAAVWLALKDRGAQAVEHLRPILSSPNPNARRILAGVIARSGHPEAVELLGQLARDENDTVRRAAVEALSGLNTPDAACALSQLADRVPPSLLAAALQTIAHPEAAAALRALGRPATEVAGLLTTTTGKPIPDARVQGIGEYADDDVSGRPVGAPALTGPDGAFYLMLPGDLGGLHLKVTLPGAKGPLFAPVALWANRANTIRVQADSLLHRLLVEAESAGG